MMKKILSVALMITLVLSNSIFVSAKEISTTPEASEKTKIIEKFQQLSNGKLKLEFHDNEGLQVFVSGTLSEKKEISGDSAVKFLEENKALLGITNSQGNFSVDKTEKDSLGITTVKVNQLIKGIPVRGQELIVHFDNNGIVKNIIGTVENKIKDITYLGKNTISEEEAIQIAKNQFNFSSLRYEPTIEKQVIIDNDTAYEVYKVNIQYLDPEIANWDVFVEVSSGKVVDTSSNIRYDGATTGSGTAVDGSTKSLNLYLSGSSYQMIDTTKPMVGDIETYTANNRQVQPGTIVSNTSSSFITETFKAPVSAHYYAASVYDFYNNLFGRNSIDGNGMSIISTAHYGSSYNNAFWDGTQMVYGDGDGTEFTYLSGDMDVVAHELTHGVTENTANLTYSNQPGALNESMSDVLGVLAETYMNYNVAGGNAWTFNSADWVVGDDVYTPGIAGDALRSLANPTLYNQPDNMSDYYNTTSDYGGVHTNSGIPNKAAFLIAQAIGNSETAQIYYRALTSYLTSSSDFLAARYALVSSATDLYGASSTEVSAINNAFDSVGVVAVNDTYEPNDTLAQSYSISSGSTYSSYISSSNDTDCYKISARGGYTITASLTNLPKDYDLYLYNSNGRAVANSYNAGTTSESITYKPKSSGTYYLVVVGYNGAYSTTSMYNLLATY